MLNIINKQTLFTPGRIIMLLQALFTVVVLLFSSTSVKGAAYGNETAALATDFPQVVILEMKFTDITLYFASVLLSNRYVLTAYQFQDILLPYTVAFSGDLTHLSKAKKHSVLNVTNLYEKLSIVKLCPPVFGFNLVSLADEDNFNYLTNTTGKYVYLKSDTQSLFYRTVDVLTDADCILDNKVGPFQQLVNYQPPNMTCTPFDNTPGTVSNIFADNSGTPSSVPVLLIDSKTAALPFELQVDLNNKSLTSTVALYKLAYLRDEILANVN